VILGTFAVGSAVHPPVTSEDKLRDADWGPWAVACGAENVSVLPKSAKGREVGVDATLQSAVMTKVNTLRTPGPITVLLCTGDGNRDDGVTSFIEMVDGFLNQGHRVVIFSWQAAFSGNYLRLAKEVAGLTIRFLDVDRERIVRPLHGHGHAAMFHAGGGGGGGGGARPAQVRRFIGPTHALTPARLA